MIKVSRQPSFLFTKRPYAGAPRKRPRGKGRHNKRCSDAIVRSCRLSPHDANNFNDLAKRLGISLSDYLETSGRICSVIGMYITKSGKVSSVIGNPTVEHFFKEAQWLKTKTRAIWEYDYDC